MFNLPCVITQLRAIRPIAKLAVWLAAKAATKPAVWLSVWLAVWPAAKPAVAPTHTRVNRKLYVRAVRYAVSSLGSRGRLRQLSGRRLTLAPGLAKGSARGYAPVSIRALRCICSGLRHVCRSLLLLALFAAPGHALAETTIKLATTTSTENSGLLDILLPAFRETSGIQVLSIAVGTGRALRLGVNGDVDVVMVHAKEAELEFLASGFGTRREEFMYNDFIIVGPDNDPAKLRAHASVTEALSAVASGQALFLSRGDDSGTHKREQSLWLDAGVTPDGNWYREAGQGMGKVLQIASELGAYTLTDRGTWLKVGDRLNLSVLFEADPKLFNHYSVIPVSPVKHPRIKNAAAEVFADWLASAEAQVLIRDYTINGQSAFIPTRLQ